MWQNATEVFFMSLIVRKNFFKVGTGGVQLKIINALFTHWVKWD